MRRISTLLAICLILIPSGCITTEKASPSPLAKHTAGYEATMQLSCDSLDAVATITQQTPECCTVTFLSPDSVQGLTFLFQSDSTDICYQGASFSLDSQSLPENAPVEIVVQALEHAMHSDAVTYESGDDGGTVTGTLNAGAFTLSLNTDGIPTRLSIPQQNLEIQFTEFQFLT